MSATPTASFAARRCCFAAPAAPVNGPAYATGGGQLLAIGEIEAGSFQPRRVFHL